MFRLSLPKPTTDEIETKASVFICSSHETVEPIHSSVFQTFINQDEPGVSMNQVLLDALAIRPGGNGQRKRKSNLDKFVGSCDLGPQWESYLQKDLNRIDEKLWT